MTKFTTVVGRTAYSDEFDPLLEKRVKEIHKKGGKIRNYHLSVADKQIVMIIEWDEKANNKRQAAQEPDESGEEVVEDGQTGAATA